MLRKGSPSLINHVGGEINVTMIGLRNSRGRQENFMSLVMTSSLIAMVIAYESSKTSHETTPHNDIQFSSKSTTFFR